MGQVYRGSTQNGTQANVERLWADDTHNRNTGFLGSPKVNLWFASIAFGSPHSDPPNAAGRGVPRTPNKKKESDAMEKEIKINTTAYRRRNLYMEKKMHIDGKTYEVVSVLPLTDTENPPETAADKIKYLINEEN